MKLKTVLLFVGVTLLIMSCTNKVNLQKPSKKQPKKILKTETRKMLAPTPPMGWNSWNAFGKHSINEKVVKETIDAIVANGLQDAGYNYVVIDGGWRDTKLGDNGELLVHPTKFPNGIKPLADYAHSKGLKLGLHVVPGSHDCGMDPVGGFNNEQKHVQQFVDWELDFIKLDLCRMRMDNCTSCPQYRFGWSEKTIEASYRKYSKLLNESGRDIVLSINAYSYRDWYPEVCDMARITGDIEARIHHGAYFNIDTTYHKHSSVATIADVSSFYADKAVNGYWNDPDMLVVGNHGLNQNEEVSHFALWCMMSSPLILGNDPRNMSEFEKTLLTNKEMIAINQDPTEQGKIVQMDDRTRILVKKLKNDEYALLLLSLDRRGVYDFNYDISKLGFDKTAKVRDVINHKEISLDSKIISVKLDINSCRLFVISK